jgi:hypothetical protein
LGATAGGIRYQQATGEIRDNIVAGNRGSGVKTDTAPTDALVNRLQARPGILRVRALALPARDV